MVRSNKMMYFHIIRIIYTIMLCLYNENIKILRRQASTVDIDFNHRGKNDVYSIFVNRRTSGGSTIM